MARMIGVKDASSGNVSLYICRDLNPDVLFILQRYNDVTGEQLGVSQFMGKYISRKYCNDRKILFPGSQSSIPIMLKTQFFDKSFNSEILEKNIPTIRLAIEIMEEHIDKCCPHPVDSPFEDVGIDMGDKEVLRQKEIKYIEQFPRCTLHHEYYLRCNVYETYCQEFTLTQNLVRRLMD